MKIFNTLVISTGVTLGFLGLRDDNLLFSLVGLSNKHFRGLFEIDFLGRLISMGAKLDFLGDGEEYCKLPHQAVKTKT